MAKWVIKFRYVVVLTWLILAVLGVKTIGQIGPRLDYTYSTPGQPGYEAKLKITSRFGIDPAFEAELPILDLPLGVTMHTAEGQAMAARTFAGARKAGPLIYADYATTHDSRFILDGGRATWAIITIPNPDYGSGAGIEGRLQPALDAATPVGGKVTLTGFAQLLSNAGPNASNLIWATLIGALLAFLVLFLVYGSPIAVLPIVMAMPAICTTFLGVLGMTYIANVSYFVNYMVVLLSLGISIDFSLIIVIRWREERDKGLDNRDAVLSAVRNAGRAIALSGVTAAVGLLSLVVLPVPFLRSIGYASALIPFIAFCVSITLLPVALYWFGPALDRFSLWPHGSTTYSKPWERWGEFVLRRKWMAAMAGIVILAIATLPVLSMKTGEPRIGSLVQTGPAADAFRRLQRSGVPSGISFPIHVMTHDGSSAVTQAKAIIASTPGVYAVFAPDNAMFRQGRDALLNVVPVAEGSQSEGKAVVERLRQRLAGVPGGIDVGGSTAEDMGFTAAVYGGFPLLLAVVALVTLAILTVSLRSVVLAAKAVLLNIVSLGAAFGFMVFFWQQGHGSELIYGMPATDSVRAWIPTVVFACLFGLSMDYEVFVLSRVREEYVRTGSTDQAVVAGLARTGRLVTCAALILMVTFLSLSIDPNQLVKVLSTTVAIGVIIDAVVIRSLLVPALVALMGRWNWWMPHWLDRVLPSERMGAH